jgi:uncharacterized membrane protein
MANDERETMNDELKTSALPPVEAKIENTMGNLLRAGVLTAAAVVLIGGIFYLLRHGSDVPDYHTFHGEPDDTTSFSGIFRSVLAFMPRGIIQFGLILLIITPVARVLFALISFLRERDRNFVVITLVVLVFLLYGFLGGKV